MEYRVINSHCGHAPLAKRASKSEAVAFADYAARVSASRGVDTLYRVFGPEGFVIAYSVVGGIIVDCHEPTIPAGHW